MKVGDRVQTPAHGTGTIKAMRGAGMVDVAVAGGQTVRVAVGRLQSNPRRRNGMERRRKNDDFAKRIGLKIGQAYRLADELASEARNRRDAIDEAWGDWDADALLDLDVITEKDAAHIKRLQGD